MSSVINDEILCKKLDIYIFCGIIRPFPFFSPYSFHFSPACLALHSLPLTLIPFRSQHQFEDNVVFYKRSDEGLLRCVARLHFSVAPQVSGSLVGLECSPVTWQEQRTGLRDTDSLSSTYSTDFDCRKVSPAPWWPESWDKRIGECRHQLVSSSSFSPSDSQASLSCFAVSTTQSESSSFGEFFCGFLITIFSCQSFEKIKKSQATRLSLLSSYSSFLRHIF